LFVRIKCIHGIADVTAGVDFDRMGVLAVSIVVRSADASWRLRDKQVVFTYKCIFIKPFAGASTRQKYARSVIFHYKRSGEGSLS